MVQKNLGVFFKKYLKKSPIFKDKIVLSSNYLPDELLHRDEQIEEIASILAPVLRHEPTSNLFIYGKPGTGKTVSVKYVLKNLESVAKQENLPVITLYVNAKLKKISDTEYRLIVHLSGLLGKQLPVTGLATSEIYNEFFNLVENKKAHIILAIDEIDYLVDKSGDDLLYILIRKNEELKNSKIILLGISNKPNFLDGLDARIKSSLSQEEILFPPYNALQLQDILKARARLAFRDNVIRSGVIEKCAAYAARENGDARKAIDLLRIAGEIAERKGFDYVDIVHVDEAQQKIDRDRYFDSIKSLPKQYQAVFYAVFYLNLKKKEVTSSEAYDFYKELAVKAGLRPLTQRRVSDILNDLEVSGLINMNLYSRGRYGRTRTIKVTLPEMFYSSIKSYLEAEFGF